MAQTQNITTFNNLLIHPVNQVNYLINSALLQVNTTFPAKIIFVNLDENQNQISATIETIINPVGMNQKSPLPAQITNVPISREAGGTAGVIIEYEPDDIVLCSVIQRDISLIKKAWYYATGRNPDSYRKFNVSDAVIVKQLTNKLPTTFIKITNKGITITSNGLPIQIDAGVSNVTVKCTDATINATNNVTVTAQGNASISATQKATVTTTGQAVVNGAFVCLGGDGTAPYLVANAVLFGTPATNTQYNSSKVYVGR